MDPKDRLNRLNPCEAVIAAAFDEVDSLHAGERDVTDLSNSTGNVSATAMPSTIEVAGYTLIREIHQGGQGVVYQALHDSSGRDVAIKVLRDAGQGNARERLRFEQEVQILRELDHPGLVTIPDLGMVDGRQYLVMPYIEGRPLDRYLDECKPTTLETLELFACICDALNAAHLNGVIHRDIKPGNILIDDDGRPRIVDFGLAKVAPQAGSSCFAGAIGAGTMTQPGQFVGSLLWASPEQADGRTRTIDVRSDVYSLGVVLYFSLTARLPFDTAGSMRDVLNRIVSEEPVSPRARRRELNRDIETIILKCLSKEPSDRYLSAGDLARDIRHYLANEPIDARRHSPAYVLRKTLRRYRVPAGIAAAFLIMLVCSTVISTVFWQRSVQRQEETEQIVRFQTDMLADLDASEMGKGLRRLIEEEHEASLQFGRLAEQEIQTRRAELERALDMVNFTNVANQSQYESIFKGVLQRIDQFGAMPLVQAGLLETVAARLGGLSMAERAVAPRERALEIYRRELGDDHPDTIRAILGAAGTYRKVHRWDDVMRLPIEAAQTARRELDVKDPLRVRAINWLGNTYLDSWDLDEARRCFRELLEAAEPHDSVAMHAEFRIARVLWNQEDYAGAESIFREQMEYLGDDARIAHFVWLGKTLSRQGKLDKAERVLRIAFERAEHEMGSASKQAQIPKSFLMGTLRRQYEASGDRSKLEESLEIGSTLVRDARRALRSSGPGFEWILETYATSLVLAGHFKDAEELLQEAVEMVQSKDSTQLAYGPTYFLCAAAERFIKLYDAWHAAEPDAGHDVQSTTWRTRLEWLIVDDVRVYIDKRAFKAAEDRLRESIDRVESDDSALSAETTPRLRREWAEVYVDLYDVWHAAEPDAGYAIRAAEWRARLEAADPPNSGGDEDR